ncbi:MAG: DUF2795 domain-containing protein [Thaumarchaeota archaeon]|nr:DUF2795 domain-containing protein [Nitrososphaerota archaeon]MCL5317635.1 DUF2795 domain-containing protein [Nitrososphaerota archaeon]
MQTRGQKGGEASLRAPSVSASELANYLRGISFPCGKKDIVDTARNNNAPDNVIDWLDRLPDIEYNNVTDVEKQFGQIKATSSQR